MSWPLTVFSEDGEFIREETFATETTRQVRYASLHGTGEYGLLCPRTELMRTRPLRVSQQEIDVIIAALRLWQQQEELEPELLEIAENGRGHGGVLQDEDIDHLIIEVLNA